MSYLVLARKYRPQKFDDVVGQKHVTKTLENAITAGRTAHAYLFSGPRGVGKTTAARILAKTINCEDVEGKAPCNVCSACVEINKGAAIDVIEIDGASNRGIDEIRELRDNVKFAPTRFKYKVYIIDEVHMLTEQAFNALLKTLEEPPSHVIFIFATTELHKIPDTILSRCQKFNFKLVSLEDIVLHLENLLKQESLEYDKDALILIARASQGSIRDSLSLLDQVISYSPKKITKEDTQFILGVVSEETLFDMVDNIIQMNTKNLINVLDEILKQGYDLHEVLKDLREHYRVLMLIKIDKGLGDNLGKTSDSLIRYEEQVEKLTLGRLTRDLKLVSSSIDEMKWSDYPRVVFELCLVKLSKPYVSPDELLERLEGMDFKDLNVGQVGSVTAVKPKKENVVKTETPKVNENNDKPKEVVEEVKETVTVEENLNTDDFDNIWRKVIDELANKKAYLATYLKNREMEVCDNKITVYFPSKFQCDGVNKNKAAIEDTMKKKFNKTVRLHCCVRESEVKESEEEGSVEEVEGVEGPIVAMEKEPVMQGVGDMQDDKPVSSQDKAKYRYTPDDIIKSEPVVEKVLDIFGGEILPPSE